MRNIGVFFAVLLVKFYRLLISPLLLSSCRFVPTCSDYGVDALKSYGVLKGGVLIARRISKCHPFCRGGFDPVPIRKKDLIIENASLNHIIDIFKLVNESYRIEKGDVGEAFKNCDRYLNIEEVREGFKCGFYLVCRKKQDNEIVGCVYYKVRGGVGECGPFAVDIGYQNFGVGLMLLSELEVRLKEQGCEIVEIHVINIRKNLIEFYNKRGFVFLREEDDISKFGLDINNLTRVVKIFILQKKL